MVIKMNEDEEAKVEETEDIEYRDEEREESDRPEPSEGYFTDIEEALFWFRSSAIYIIMDLTRFAAKKDDDIEGSDYYDGFLSRIETLLDEYLEDIEDLEKTLDHIYDGDWDLDAGDNADADE